MIQNWIPYCGTAPLPAEIMARWNFDPVLLAGCALAVVIYRYAFPEASPWRRARFAAAIGAFVFLYVSPFCALGSALFSARVVHHVALTVVVAPLLVAAVPPERLRIGGSLAAWTGVQAVVFWVWHAPPAYGWALSGDAAYWLMQATLLFSAAGFWAAARRAPAPAAAAALLATTVQMGLLGALLTFAGAPLYAPHILGTVAWGYSPLEDQQLAGLIMWVPAAGLYLGAALLLVHRWLAEGRTAAAVAR